MSVLFNHARRYDLYDRNPIQWVRQSAKRRSPPDVLTSNEVRRLLAALEPRERIMVLLDVATGLRQSELFAVVVLGSDKDIAIEGLNPFGPRFRMLVSVLSEHR
jgi:integrase